MSESTWGAIEEYRKTKPVPATVPVEAPSENREKHGVGMKCPVCGEQYHRHSGLVQQHVKWDGVLIRRRICSLGHHYCTEERVSDNKLYNEFQAWRRAQNKDKQREYWANYRGKKVKKEKQ